MAISMKWYGAGAVAVMKGLVDLDSDTIKASLHTSSYTPNQDTDDFKNDATNELSTANGYTANGVTLANKAVSYDSSSQQARWDFDDLAWTVTSTGFTFRYVVFYKSRGGASSADDLIGYVDMGADIAVLAGTYTLQINAAGSLYIDVT